MQRMRTAKSLKKTPVPIAAPVAIDPEVESQMELELCWCVQQLEKALDEGKLSKKHQEDAIKNLKTLKSKTAPVIKKLQIMRAAFGDYRSKMKEEEKKLQMAANQVKFTQNGDDVPTKSKFVKKSAILTSGKDFRFNFTPDTTADSTPDAADVTKPCENIPPKSFASVSKDLNLSSTGEFKFNFAVDDESSINSLDKSFNSLLSNENSLCNK